MKKQAMQLLAIMLTIFLASTSLARQKKDDKEKSGLNSGLLSGLKMRGIGPALMSGRIGDIVVDPQKRSTWYIAVSSGGVWKTVNSGATWSPIFDKYGSYSIGCLALDPNNRFVLWVGTGENNSQRSVGYGDGVYKSLDGGKSFKKMGLDNSEHIGKILVDPRDSEVVYVASQGPLWSSGGDRGLFKTTDGGKTWANILEISEHTGVNEVHFDPRNPDVLYAVAYQRRRHVWTLIDGGPESGVYKSTDAGATWRKINKGLPSVDKGRIGMTISPVKPDVLYVIVEAAQGKGGFFRSTDGGENWSKRSSYVSGSPQYYQEIFADPHKYGRIYSLDTFMMVSEDDGKTFTRLGEAFKHVDNHALAFDPNDEDHLIIGSDGGLYETWDRGKNYHYFANLPITQFYKVAVDNDAPFYNVYGGTQDNATQGGPSRTNNIHGIRNSDWFVTVFGDGFGAAIDPENPDIVYSQWQYGNLIRYDRKTGERIDIKPQEEKDGVPLRWNWDSALIISPHSSSRLYFGSQILFRSEDRGNSWRVVSPDLTRNMDRNKLEVMGRVWEVDAVAKNNSTSFYGTIVSLAESELAEDVIYVGTDDGLIQVTENGGESWTKYETFPGVPEMAYVNDIEASAHDANTVFAAFNNHKMGDFKPYLLKSTNRGKSWVSIAGDLPERGSVYTVVQDHVNPDLLFVGTEFGIFTTVDGGEKWLQMKSGMPVIAVRDLKIQRRENDLVAASFGRGFFILDDYSPLRELNEALVEKPAHIFPVKIAQMYVQSAPLAGQGKAFQGASFYTAPNPPFGATFTYYLKESLKTQQAERRSEDSKKAKEGIDAPYPSWADLKAEDREEKPSVTLAIRDEQGGVVRRIKGKTSKGVHRATWDFRYPGLTPTRMNRESNGPMALPGKYTVSLEQHIGGETTELVAPTAFEAEALGAPTIPVADRAAVLAFQRKTAELQRAVMGANSALRDAAEQIRFIKKTIESSTTLDIYLRNEARNIELKTSDLQEAINGDRTQSRRSEPAPRGLMSRIQQIVRGHWSTTAAPTESHRRNYDIAADEFEIVLGDIRRLVETDLPALHGKLEAAGAPWTPGRGVPDWKK